VGVGLMDFYLVYWWFVRVFGFFCGGELVARGGGGGPWGI